MSLWASMWREGCSEGPLLGFVAAVFPSRHLLCGEVELQTKDTYGNPTRTAFFCLDQCKWLNVGSVGSWKCKSEREFLRLTCLYIRRQNKLAKSTFDRCSVLHSLWWRGSPDPVVFPPAPNFTAWCFLRLEFSSPWFNLYLFSCPLNWLILVQ